MSARVYKYGLLPPIIGAELVDQQMVLAHRYKNRLIEIEMERRAAVQAVERRLGLEEAYARVETLEADLEAARESVRKARAAGNKHAASRDGQSLRAELKAARATKRDARLALREDPAVLKELAAVGEQDKECRRAAREACGLYWGTYLIVEQSRDTGKKGKLRFRRWDGNGAVAVELIHGISVEEALSGTHTFLRLNMSPVPVPGRGGKPLPRLFMRVGSDGRAPIFAEWPLIMHRPLPEVGRIKWAKVVRRRTATRVAWELHVTLELPEDFRTGECGSGAVAVNLSWFAAKDVPTTVAATWANNRGDAADVTLDPAVPGMIKKADELRSIRDRSRDGVRDQIVAWRDKTKPEGELGERLRNIGQWIACARFAALALWWREHRVEGDVELFEALEVWRRHDKHLWLWEAHARRRAIARRLDQYRVFAAGMAARHDTLILEDKKKLGLDRLAADPLPESGELANRQGNRQRVSTAPDTLRQALEQAFISRGGRIVTVAPSKTVRGMLAEFERSGGEEKVVTARPSRFSKIREKMAAKAACAAA
jgi:hypothetical protein